MDGNAVGMGIGGGLSGFFDAYKWMKTLEQQDRQEKDRYSWLGEQEDIRDQRDQSRLRMQGEKQRDLEVLRQMGDEEDRRGKLAAKRTEDAEADQRWEAFVAQAPPQLQTILRAKKIGGVTLQPDDLETPEDRATRDRSKRDADFEDWKRKENFSEGLYRGRPKPTGGAGTSQAQLAAAERWKQSQLAGLTKQFREGAIGPDELEQGKLDISNSYLSQLGQEPIAELGPEWDWRGAKAAPTPGAPVVSAPTVGGRGGASPRAGRPTDDQLFGPAMPTAPATVKMRAPTGEIQDVPADQVEHFKKLGAVVVR